MKAFALASLLIFTVPAHSADLLSKIAGTYTNTAGDEAVVKVERAAQDDLFKPAEYEINIEFYSDKVDFGFIIDKQGVTDDGNSKGAEFKFSNECDDSGCTTSKGSIVFQKGQDGKLEALLTSENSVEVSQAIQETYGEQEEYTDKQVQKYCQDTYAPDAIGYMDGGYAGCDYSYSTTLKLKQ